jgi:hypothetical protein
MEAEAANARRCQDRPGTYEVWYLTINDPATRRGFWIRYSTLHPSAGSKDLEPEAALWAFMFDREDPAANWGAKRTVPMQAVQSRARPFHLQIGDAALTREGGAGELRTERGTARWDLRWESREPPFPFLRPRWQGLSSVANIGVQPALSITGTIEINGRSHHLDGAPGGQQHTWGTSHALAWNWGFASGHGFWVDGATSRVRSRLGRVVTGTAVGAQARSERFLFNGPIRALLNGGAISPRAWIAAARLGDRRLVVKITPRPEDLIGVTYADPAGGKRYCYHTELADLDLRLFRRSEPLAQITRPAVAAFEYASESLVPALPILIS